MCLVHFKEINEKPCVVPFFSNLYHVSCTLYAFALVNLMFMHFESRVDFVKRGSV
jgi:hypothetical protein